MASTSAAMGGFTLAEDEGEDDGWDVEDEGWDTHYDEFVDGKEASAVGKKEASDGTEEPISENADAASSTPQEEITHGNGGRGGPTTSDVPTESPVQSQATGGGSSFDTLPKGISTAKEATAGTIHRIVHRCSFSHS